MLNIQELANFITEKLNIISTTQNAGYVFDIYAEVGKGKDDSSIKGVVKSLNNNPLVVKSLASVKTIYRVELSVPNGISNKNLVKIEDIINEFVKTYEGTQQTFTGGVGSFELTYAHLAENYTIKNEIGGIVPLQFEMTVNFTDNGLLGSSKTWLLNGVEIPYLNEVILLNKEGQTNRISKEKYNKTIVLAQTKYYKFTIPFDKTNTVCTTLQADMLNGDFDKTYTLSYYDGTTYTEQNPFTTTVSIYQSGDSKSDGGAISMFEITFADVSATEIAPKYTLELFSTPFDENNERWFDSVEEQTAWYNNLPNRTPAVQIKAPNLNTISNTTQVYDFNGINNFPYSPTELANMNVARINEKTNDVNTYEYQINTRRGRIYNGSVSGGDDNVSYQFKTGFTEYCPIKLAGTIYRLRFAGGEPEISYADGTLIPLDEYYDFTLDYVYYLQEDENTYNIVDLNGTTIVSLAKSTTTSSVQFYAINERLLTLQVNMQNEQLQSILILEDNETLDDITTTRQFSLTVRYGIIIDSSTSYTDGWITQNGVWVTDMERAVIYDWEFSLIGNNYYADETITFDESTFDIYNNEEQIATNIENGGTFAITEPINYYHYYYTIQSSEIGANNQIVLTLRLNTFQTYVVNPALKFSECFINKAHLDRFVDNGNGTVSFNGGVESPLFEREETQNVAKRLVTREVLKYDYGKYNIEDYTQSQIERFRRVEEWFQTNVRGWLYAFFPITPGGKYPVYKLNWNTSINASTQLVTMTVNPQRYRLFNGGTSLDSNFVVFACPLYKTNKKIILKNITPATPTKDVQTSINISKDAFMNYVQNTLTLDNTSQPLPYVVKFSTKPPIGNINTNLMGFDVDENGNLISKASSTYRNIEDGNVVSLENYDFKAVCTLADGATLEDSAKLASFTTYGCFACETSFIPTLDLEDYIIVNPITFPKSNTNYIEKTFYKLRRYDLTQTVPQAFTLVRPNVNVQNIGITISYKTTGSGSSAGTWEIENKVGRYTFQGGKYKLTIKDSSMIFEILQLESDFKYFEYIDFKERVYGLVGANKNPIYNPKLLNSDYRSLRLTNERGGQFEYDIQKLNKETLQTAVTEQITADLQRTYFRAINTDGVYQQECSQNLTGLVDSAEVSMPLATEAWRKTLAEQPNFFAQRNVEHLKSALGAGFAGFLGGGSNIGLSGGIKGGLVGAMAGMGISAINSVIGDYFSDDNMDKQPAIIQNANGNVVFNLSYTYPGMTIEQYALLPQEERIINDQMFANGYTYNRIDQIRKFTHTRKYFNTIMAMIETMSGLPLSNEVRDDIKQRFANGIRLWHDDEIQYEKENYELWLEE